MTCEEMHVSSLLEKYVAGRLTEEQKVAVEDHFADCDQCFAEVEGLSAAAAALRAMPRPAPRRAAPRWTWILAAAAALALIAVAMRFVRPGGRSAASRYTELAQFDPPAWNPMVVRSAESDGEESFRRAMEPYRNHDWQGCETALAPLVAPAGAPASARFYLGICRLLSHDTAGGAAALRHTIEAGDTPYLEESHYYLAKALLAENDPAGARAELEKAVAMHGDLEPQATLLLSRIH